jgi:hypothetical protein
MMGPVLWSLTLPLLLGAAQHDLPAGWKVFASKDGLFTVNMPSEPIKKKQQITTAAAGKLKVELLIAEGRHDSYFVVSYCDFPPTELKKGQERKRLDQACIGAVESSTGKIREKKPITLDRRCPRSDIGEWFQAGIGSLGSIKFDVEYPGRELVLEKDGAVIAKMRIYLVENRLYQVMVLGNGSIFAPKEKDVGIFLDSFRLNN